MLSQHQKFSRCQVITQELASLASEVGTPEFHSRLAILKNLRDIWANGEVAVVSVLEDQSSGIFTTVCYPPSCMALKGKTLVPPQGPFLSL